MVAILQGEGAFQFVQLDEQTENVAYSLVSGVLDDRISLVVNE